MQDWILEYLNTYKKNELKPSTYSTYLGFLNKHIKEAKIGKKDINKLNGEELQKFYNEKLETGLSSKTVRHIRVLINGALEQAVRLRKINFNPDSYTKLPPKQQFIAHVLTIEEVQRLQSEACQERLYPMVITTIYLGLRKGEIMALKWKNIDLERGLLYVKESLCRVNDIVDEKGRQTTKWIELEPKTKKSKRCIPLPNFIIEMLKDYKIKQEKYIVENSDIYENQDLVFANELGGFLQQREFLKDYYKFLDRYKISHVRFHDLRHTCASLLLSAGESPKVIQEILGHSTITTTMDIYAHLSDEAKAKGINRIDDLINKKNENE